MDMARRVCPQCSSTDVEAVGVASAIGIGEVRCKECGYTAPEFPVTEADQEELEAQREALADAGTESSLPQPQDGFDRMRFFTGIAMILLGLGSVPLATQTVAGLWGSLLAPLGVLICYRQWRDR